MGLSMSFPRERQFSPSIRVQGKMRFSTTAIAEEPVMISAAFAGNRQLLIGTQENLLICDLEKDSVTVTGTLLRDLIILQFRRLPKPGDTSDFIVGTEENGLFRLSSFGHGDTLQGFGPS